MKVSSLILNILSTLGLFVAYGAVLSLAFIYTGLTYAFGGFVDGWIALGGLVCLSLVVASFVMMIINIVGFANFAKKRNFFVKNEIVTCSVRAVLFLLMIVILNNLTNWIPNKMDEDSARLMTTFIVEFILGFVVNVITIPLAVAAGRTPRMQPAAA